MQITIYSHNDKINEEVKAYTRKKLQKLENYNSIIGEIKITYTQDGTKKANKYAEGVAHIKGKTLIAKSKAAETYTAAMDMLIDTLTQQINNAKERN